MRGYCPQWRSWEKGRAHLSREEGKGSMKGAFRLPSWKPPACVSHVSTFWVPRPAKNLRWHPRVASISEGCLRSLGCQDWNMPQKPSIPPLILSTSKLLLLGEDDIVE